MYLHSGLIVFYENKRSTNISMDNKQLKFVKNSEGFSYFEKDFSSGDFKILNFTDLHLGYNKKSSYLVLKIMERHIAREKPDLVTITGDICLGSLDREDILKLISLFESQKQFFAVVLGNHDGEYRKSMSREDIIKLYSSSPFCVSSVGPSNIYGFGNYIVNVFDLERKLKSSLIFMDSGDYIKNTYKKYGVEKIGFYDFIKPDQIDWYKESLSSIKRQNHGKLPPSALFIHIALPEYKIAYDAAVEGTNKHDPATLLFGMRQEKECSPHFNSGLFDAMLENNTSLVICGHEHINDYVVSYKGVTFVFSLSLSYNSYSTRQKKLFKKVNPNAHHTDGATLLFANEQGFKVKHCYNQENLEVFKGLKGFFKYSRASVKTIPNIAFE